MSFNIPCPLKHPNNATKICTQSDCNSHRLTCTQCLLSIQHLQHKSEDLLLYINNLKDVSKTKKAQKQNMKQLQSDIADAVNMIKAIKKHFEDTIASLEQQIQTTFNEESNKIKLGYKKINLSVEKLVNILPTQLEAVLLDIHLNQKTIKEATKKSNDIKVAISQIQERVKSDFEDNLKLVKRHLISFRPILIPPRIIPRIQHSNSFKRTIQAIVSSSIQQILRNTPPLRNLNTSLVSQLNQINPVQKLQWSETLKGSYIEINGSLAKKNPTSKGWNKAIVLSSQPLSNNRIFWKVKLQKCTHLIVTGICAKKVVIENKYNFNASDIIHGCYGIGTNGCLYTYRDQNKNNKKRQQFQQINKSGVILSFMFNPKSQRLTFQVQQQKKELCQLKVPKLNGDQYYAFAFMYQADDKVRLI